MMLVLAANGLLQLTVSLSNSVFVMQDVIGAGSLPPADADGRPL